MTRELLISILGDRVRVECPQSAREITAANTVLLSQGNHAMVVGEWPETLERDKHKYEARIGAQSHIATLFDAESLDPLIAAVAVNYFALAAGAKLPRLNAFRRLVCRITFPDYATIPTALRHEFEASAQFYTGLKELWINDQRVSYPIWAQWVMQAAHFLPGPLAVLVVFAALPAAAALIPILHPPVSASMTYDVWLGLLAVGVVIVCAGVMVSVGLLWRLLVGCFLPRPLSYLVMSRKHVVLLTPPNPAASDDHMLTDVQS